MRLPRGNDEVAGLVVLDDADHRVDIVGGVAPVAVHVDVAETRSSPACRARSPRRRQRSCGRRTALGAAVTRGCRGSRSSHAFPALGRHRPSRARSLSRHRRGHRVGAAWPRSGESRSRCRRFPRWRPAAHAPGCRRAGDAPRGVEDADRADAEHVGCLCRVLPRPGDRRVAGEVDRCGSARNRLD